jgi:hypothetical protein
MCVPSVVLRKPGCAGLSANGTPKIFNPTVEDDHPANILLWRAWFKTEKRLLTITFVELQGSSFIVLSVAYTTDR